MITTGWILAIVVAAAVGFRIGRRRVIALQRSLKALDFRATKIRDKAWREGYDVGRAAEREFLVWEKNHGGRR